MARALSGPQRNDLEQRSRLTETSGTRANASSRETRSRYRETSRRHCQYSGALSPPAVRRQLRGTSRYVPGERAGAGAGARAHVPTGPQSRGLVPRSSCIYLSRYRREKSSVISGHDPPSRSALIDAAYVSAPDAFSRDDGRAASCDGARRPMGAAGESRHGRRKFPLCRGSSPLAPFLPRSAPLRDAAPRAGAVGERWAGRERRSAGSYAFFLCVVPPCCRGVRVSRRGSSPLFVDLPTPRRVARQFLAAGRSDVSRSSSVASSP